MAIAYLDGEFLPEEQAKIPISDRGFLYGDGAYATIQVRDGVPLFLETHLHRLKQHAEKLGICPPNLTEESVYATIRQNGAFEGIWRLKIILTGGSDPLMRLPPERSYGHHIITCGPYALHPYGPLKLACFPYPLYVCHAQFKSLAHLNRLYVMEYGISQGKDDAVTATENGVLHESAFGNLFWIEGKKLFTPDPSLPLNFGVTITQVIECARSMGFEVRYVSTKLVDISSEATLFRTNTLSGIRPIIEIGDRQFKRKEPQERLFLDSYERRIINWPSQACQLGRVFL